MSHFLNYLYEKTLKKYNLYKKSPYQVYHLSRTDDYYTHIEFPKCGRTWIRYMICLATSKKYNIPLRNTLHDICYQELLLPRVYYVHGFHPEKKFQDYSYKNFLNKIKRPKGIIFQIRNPEKVITSFYYQCLYKKFFNIKIDDIKKFIRDPRVGIEKYIEYIEFYLPKIESVNHLIIKYEDIVQNPEKQLTNVLNFVELDLPDNLISEIVLKSTKENMREIEEQGKYKLPWLMSVKKGVQNSYKVRTLNSNSEKIFDNEDIEYINKICNTSKCLKKLMYI
jgi:Sulfotransferase domain